MYESYWQLNEKPFETTSAEGFYYPSEVHQAAMLKLRYVIDNRRSAALLAGPAGLGKTILVQTLLRQLDDQFGPIVQLVYPLMPPAELLSYLCAEFTTTGDQRPALSIHECVRQLQHTISENATAGRHALLVIDEAHLLAETGALESVRLLLNFEVSGRPALTLLLVGQPSILSALDRTPGLEERFGVKCLMRPFVLEETISYVSHRLNAGGCDRNVFNNEALEVVHQLSHGIPRRINRLCDLALLIGYAEEQSSISAEQIEAVAEELITVRAE